MSNKSKNQKSQYFAFTLDNYTNEQEKLLQSFGKTWCKHICYGYEKAPTTGTKHLQGCLVTKTRVRWSTLKNRINIDQLHLEPCRKIYEANLNYCKKSGDIWQWPHDFVRTKNSYKEKQTFREAIQLAKEGKLDQIDSDKMIKYEAKFKKIYAEAKPVDNMYLDNKNGNFFPDFFLFLHGSTGTGKSFRFYQIVYILEHWWSDYCNARQLPYRPLGVYRKKCNKWWDGYLGEDIVLIEEIEPSWASIAASHLKIWLDQYPFPVEVKGSYIERIRPKFFILTSNYSLSQLFVDKEGNKVLEDLKPIERRVYSIHVNNKFDDINWPNLVNLTRYFDTIKEVKYEIDKTFANHYKNKSSTLKLTNEDKASISVTPIEEEPPSERNEDIDDESVIIIESDNEESPRLKRPRQIEMDVPDSSMDDRKGKRRDTRT